MKDTKVHIFFQPGKRKACFLQILCQEISVSWKAVSVMTAFSVLKNTVDQTIMKKPGHNVTRPLYNVAAGFEEIEPSTAIAPSLATSAIAFFKLPTYNGTCVPLVPTTKVTKSTTSVNDFAHLRTGDNVGSHFLTLKKWLWPKFPYYTSSTH